MNKLRSLVTRAGSKSRASAIITHFCARRITRPSAGEGKILSRPNFLRRLRAAAPRTLPRACLSLLAALVCAPALRAQTNDTATIRGQVLNQNGAAITQTKVVAANELTGFSREAATGGEGRYTVAGLPLT